jgi:excisionase family DNA binding protein
MAAELGVGLSLIYKELNKGNLPGVRVGDRWFVTREAFLKYFSGNNKSTS